MEGVFLLIAAVAAVVPQFRQYGAWESCQIGGGGYLQHAAWSPADARRLYLASDVGGLYRSDDGGSTWRMLHGALAPQLYGVRDIIAHPRRADSFLIAAGDGYHPLSGVWRSDDAGASFRQVLSGAFWGNEGTRIWGDVLVNSPDGSETVFAAPPGAGVWRSDDFGGHWQSLGLTNVYARALVVDRTDVRRIWVVGDRRKPNDKWTSCREGLFFTADGGQCWRRMDKGEYPGEFVQDPKDPSLLHGTFRATPPLKWSRDGGETWHEYDNSGIFPKPTDQFHDGFCQALTTGPDFVLAGCSGGNIYRLRCGSRKWEKVKIEERRFGDWYAVTAGGFNPFGASLGWIGVSPHNPDEWIFTDWYALYRSRNAGHGWELAIDGIEMTVLHSLAQDANNPNRIHCGMADVGGFRSDDSGRSFGNWQRSVLHDNVKCIATCAGDGNRVYALGPKNWGWQSNQINVSTDGGTSWRRPAGRGLPVMAKRGCSTVAVDPTNADRVVIVVSGRVAPGDGGVYMSANAGDDWRWIGEGLPERELFASDIWRGSAEVALSRDGTMVAVSSVTGEVFRWGREGRWVPTQVSGKGARVVADAKADGRFYLILRERGLCRSEDGGISWESVSKSPILGVCTDLTRPGRVACISSKGAAWSSNAGRSWQRIDGLPPRLGSVLCFAGDWLLCGTGGSGIFRTFIGADKTSKTDILKSIYERLSPDAKAFYDSISAPVVVGVPPAAAVRDMVLRPDGEIRHYGWKNVCGVKKRVYISSRDLGLNWTMHFASADDPGAYSMTTNWPSHELRQIIDLRARHRRIAFFSDVNYANYGGNYHAAVALSDDDGQSWRRVQLPVVPNVERQGAGDGYPAWYNTGCEPSGVELKDGTILVALRTSGPHVAFTRSRDGGETWETPKPDARFWAANTMPYLMRLSDGRILFIWNNTQRLPTREKSELPELSPGELNGAWETVFTNRDALHAAVSSDEGETWTGFREVALTETRNAPDFRELGNDIAEEHDKSVHQTQGIELPGGKALLAYGQNSAARRIAIFDVNWLNERERREDFRHGLGSISHHLYVKSLTGGQRGWAGHCAWNRVPGVVLAREPDAGREARREAMWLARPGDPRLVSDVAGAVWNFPAAKAGVIEIECRIEGEGFRLTLADRWINPCDVFNATRAPFSVFISGETIGRGWRHLVVKWEGCAVTGTVDGVEVFRQKMTTVPEAGYSYLHLQSPHDRLDPRGTFFREIQWQD